MLFKASKTDYGPIGSGIAEYPKYIIGLRGVSIRIQAVTQPDSDGLTPNWRSFGSIFKQRWEGGYNPTGR